MVQFISGLSRRTLTEGMLASYVMKSIARPVLLVLSVRATVRV